MQESREACQILPAADRCIDIQRIKLDPPTDAASAFGGEQRGATTQKTIEDDIAAVRAMGHVKQSKRSIPMEEGD